MDDRVLVVGGAADPSLIRLLSHAQRLGVAVRSLLIHPEHTPRLTWDLGTDTLTLDGEPLHPRGVLLRADVFWSRLDARPEAGWRSDAWHATLSAWAHAHPDVRLPNRHAVQLPKPDALLRARRLGLPIPETVITNELELLLAREGAVAKPVAGGGHCHPLDALLRRTPVRDGATAAPATVQARMPGLDVRVYAIGAARFTFALHSDHLDYRLDPHVRVEPYSDLPAHLMGPFDALLQEVGLDFAAADFKQDEAGALRFLEVNNQPMFAAFDDVAGGALSEALLSWLGATGPRRV